MTCGKEISQSGPARKWVHEDSFYSKADHPAVPRGQRPPPSPTAPAAPVDDPALTPTSDKSDKPQSAAELRRRLRQNAPEIKSAELTPAQRRALSATEEPTGPSTAELAARRLRELRHREEEQDRDQR